MEHGSQPGYRSPAIVSLSIENEDLLLNSKNPEMGAKAGDCATEARQLPQAYAWGAPRTASSPTSAWQDATPKRSPARDEGQESFTTKQAPAFHHIYRPTGCSK